MRSLTLAVGALALIALAGCGPKAEEPAPPPEPAITEPPAPMGMIIGTVQAASVAKTENAGTVRVCAKGKAPTSGYSNARLEPIVSPTPPADGIYEFEMMVDAPTDPILLPVEEEFAAQFDWIGAPADLKGVRVKATYGEPAVGMLGGKSAC